MEQAVASSPLSTPDIYAFPSPVLSTTSVLDGTHTSEVSAEIGRGAARADEHGRLPPIVPPATLSSPADAAALDAMNRSIERARFEASPEGTAASTTPSP